MSGPFMLEESTGDTEASTEEFIPNRSATKSGPTYEQ